MNISDILFLAGAGFVIVLAGSIYRDYRRQGKLSTSHKMEIIGILLAFLAIIISLGTTTIFSNNVTPTSPATREPTPTTNQIAATVPTTPTQEVESLTPTIPVSNTESTPTHEVEFRTIELKNYSQLVIPETNLGLQPGYQLLGNIPFDLGWRTTANCGYLPERPNEIVIDVSVDSARNAYFLLEVSVDYSEFDGQQIGNLKLVFDGLPDMNIPLIVGENIRDWIVDRSGTAIRANPTPSDPTWRQVWSASIPASDIHYGYDIIGTVDMLTVPIPDIYQQTRLDKIVLLDTQNAFSNPCISLLAITVEN